MEYRLVRSRRKTIGIVVGSNEVVVRAPHYLSEKEIKEELKEHQIWIQDKIREQENKRKIVDDYRASGRFMLFGNKFEVRKVTGKGIELKEGNLLIGEDANIDKFLKNQLTLVTDNLISKWAHINKPTSITYRKQKTIWGSCTIKGKINININLAKAPVDVIEYIYIHELVHLEHRNHGREFWHGVEILLPDYKKSKKWLKDNGHLIGCDFMLK